MSIDRIRQSVRQFARLAEWFTVAMFIGIFVLFIVTIFQRYVLAQPVNWIDEVIMILFLWGTLLTEAFVLRDSDQVRFDVVYDLCGPRGRRFIGLAGSALLVVLFTCSAPTILGYILFLWRQRTDALDLRLDAVYFCFFIYWVAVIVRALDRFLLLCSKDWAEHVRTVSADEKANVLG